MDLLMKKKKSLIFVLCAAGIRSVTNGREYAKQGELALTQLP